MKKLIMLSILCALTLSTYSQNIFNKKLKQEGCISGDCENGYGKYITDSDIIYKGEWRNGDCHGLGTMTFPDGEKYVGEFKDDKRHGQGTYTYASGNEYVGEWKDDMRHGQGTYTYANGDKYVGEHKDDKRHGQGTYTMADVTVYKGLFENGEFIGEE